MKNAIIRIESALIGVDNALKLLHKELGCIPTEDESRALTGYFLKILEEKAEFRMQLDKIKKKYEKYIDEEFLADLVKQGKLNIFAAADRAYNKQKFWNAMQRISER